MGIVATLRRLWALRASRRRVSRSKRSRRFYRVHFEVLEDRTAPSATNPATQQLLQNYGQIPLSFEANQGQTASQVNFLSQGSGYALFLTPTGAVLNLQTPAGSTSSQGISTPFEDSGCATPAAGGVALAINLVGANTQAQAVGQDQLPWTSNYFVGNDPSQWRTGIANYGKVAYQDIYPGVNLVYYGNQQQLEYDFVVAAGADPGSIRFDVQGADSLSLDASGNLVVDMPSPPTPLPEGEGNVVVEHAPVIYQEIGGKQQSVAGQFVLLGADEVGFQVGPYDASQSLVIDPVLSYSTYLGGNSDDYGCGIAVDGSGNAYVTVWTLSSNFPTTTGAYQTSLGGGWDAFVTKLNASGTALVYSTYLGGNGNDWGYDIAVDGSGNAYVTGYTDSSNFPTTTGAYQTSLGGGWDAFVTKLNASGTALVYSTYLGGNGNDWGYGIAVDGSGNAYVTGMTGSSNFPTTTGAYQTSLASTGNAFVTKLNASGTALVYSTYLGGNNGTYGNGIAVDGSGNVYVTGLTRSSNFPTTTGAYQTSLGGYNSAFVTKLNASGTALVYSTYLGGNPYDEGDGIAVDGSGDAYVTGMTESSDFPTTTGAYQTSLGGGENAFVTKLNASGTALVYSTYLGGNSDDWGYGIAVDGSGNAYVTGYTESSNFPTTTGAYQTNLGGDENAFVTKLNASGTALVYSTYLGGNSDDAGEDIAVDSSGNAYVTGRTWSSNFPTTTGAYQTSLDGSANAFATKLALGSTTTTTTSVTSSVNPSVFGQSVTFTATVAWNGINSVLPTGTVTFEDGGNSIGTGTLTPTPLPGEEGTNGTATFTTSSLAAGSDTITAVYGGDTNFAISSGTLTGGQTVNQAGTATVLTSSTNPSVFGQSVTFTAVVSGEWGVGSEEWGVGSCPSGTVTFEDGGNSIGTGALTPTPLPGGEGTNGTATFTTSSLAVGSETITAVYGGDTNFAISSGTLAGGQVVNQAASSTTLTISGSGSIDLSTGRDVNDNLITTSGAADAHWTVSEQGGGTGFAQVVAPGSADWSGWSPDGPNSSWIARNANTANNGLAPYTFSCTFDLTGYELSTVSLAGQWGIDDTGILTLNGNQIGSQGSSGQEGCCWPQSFSVSAGSPFLNQGLNTLAITMTWCDENFGGVRLEGMVTGTLLAGSTTVFGQAVTCTATVSAVSPGAGTPTGTVTFEDSGIPLSSGTVTLDSSGTATFTTSSLSVTGSPHTITAVYGGDSNFTTSPSNSLVQTILPGTIYWANPAGGDWDTAANWVGDVVPESGDNAVISMSGITITHSSPIADSILSLTCSASLSFSNGSLDIAGNATVGGNLLLAGGMLEIDGTLQVATGGTFTLQGGTLSNATVLAGTTVVATPQGGTLDGVTADGDLDLATNYGAYVFLVNGLTLNNAAVWLGNAVGTTYGGLYFDGAQTLGGTGAVVFGKSGNNFLDTYNTTWNDPAAGTLTIGAGITIRGSGVHLLGLLRRWRGQPGDD